VSIQEAKIGDVAHRRHARNKSGERKGKLSMRACKEAGHPPTYRRRMSVKTREIQISNTASRKHTTSSPPPIAFGKRGQECKDWQEQGEPEKKKTHTVWF